MAVQLSFLDFLRTGELPPIRRGTTRSELLRLLGTPTSWVSRDDPLFQPPRRDYRISNSISFGALTFSFDANDRVDHIMLSPCSHGEQCSYPLGSLYFPDHTTTIHAVADLMRSQGIPFEDISFKRDGSELKTKAGVVLFMSASPADKGGIFYCGHEPRKESASKINVEQLHKECASIIERFGNKSFEDMIAAFGPPIEERAPTATSGRVLVFAKVAKTIQYLVVLELPNGKFEFRFQAAESTANERVA